MDRRYFCFTLATVAALLSNPAFARRRSFRFGRGLRGGVKNYGPNILNRDQLKACLLEERDIDGGAANLGATENTIRRKQQELQQFAAEIDARSRTLNRYSQSEVDSYNRMVDRYERRRIELNSEVDRYNGTLRRHNERVNNLNSRCSNKQYYEDDMEAVQAALGFD